MAKKADPKATALALKLVAVVVLVAGIAMFVLVFPHITGTAGSSDASAQPAGEQAAPHEQTFESEAAIVTYRDKLEATPGNAMVNFALENRTGSAVMVSAENVVVNGEYSVEVLGGSAAPIAPGATGSVSLAFGYSVQTPIQTVDELRTLACDLVLRDNDALTSVVGSVPVSVEL